MKQLFLIGIVLVFFSVFSRLAFAGDVEAKLNSTNGSTNFEVQDSGGTIMSQIDSDGNMVIKGGLRLDAGGTEYTTAEDLIVDGNVGIGTTGPGVKLDINQSADNKGIRIYGYDDVSGSYGNMFIDSYGTFQLTSAGAVVVIGGYNWLDPTNFNLIDYGSGSYTQFRDGADNPVMTITGTPGNIGIGTTAPRGNLHVVATGVNTYGHLIVDRANSGGNGGEVTIRNSAGGTNATGVLGFELDGSTAYDSSGNNANNAEIRAVNVGGGGSDGSDLRFSNWSGSANNVNMVIQYTGNIGIGTTGPLYKVHVNVGTNQNLQIRPGSSDASSVFLNAANDANTVQVPMEFSASKFEFMNGNVGIGTTNPSKLIDAFGTIRSTRGTSYETQCLQLDGGSDNVNSYNIITSSAVNDNEKPLIIRNYGNTVTAGDNNYIQFQVGYQAGVTAMTINKLGNVGIGTTGPATRLQVGSIADSVYSLASGKTIIVGTNYALSSTQRGTLDLTSNAMASLGEGPSITFTQQTSQYVAGYEKVIGAIKGYWDTTINTWTNGALGFYTNSGDLTGTLNEVMTIKSTGNVGIGTTAPATQLHCTGQITMDGVSGSDHVLDVAEVIPVADDVEEGDVISIDDTPQRYQFVKSSKPNDSLVAGVISSNQKNSKSIPAMFIGNDKQREADNPGQKYKYLTIAGQVAVKVCLEGGPIRKGDLLTTSSTAGYAMHAQKLRHGTIIGKALEDFDGKNGEKGMIIALFTLL